MEKEIIIKVITDLKQPDIELCKDAIQALNEKLLLVHKVDINNKCIYNYDQGGFIKEDNKDE